MKLQRRSSAPLSRCIARWGRGCWNRLTCSACAANFSFEDYLSYVSNPCRLFTKVSDWIGYRVDLIVAETVVVELKTVDHLARVHDAQLLTYLRLGGWKVGLLINFNVALLRDGIHRRVLGLEEQ